MATLKRRTVNLQILAKKLRQTADLLDDLIGIERTTTNETSAVAKAIRSDLPKNRKKHWTQTNKGRKILAKRSKEIWAKKKAHNKSISKVA
jgi:hypothetical protein